ncbi:MAG: SHOCT domain-containing protein [Lachnospiraceae bacterium]|nr:SHOCT domain-containing protein [Lachnospiraceae bacterium]
MWYLSQIHYELIYLRNLSARFFSAYDCGVITQEEYEMKKQDLL